MKFVSWVRRCNPVPLGPSETEVTLTYNRSAVQQFVRERGTRLVPFGPAHLTDSAT
ncbi:hypothetical protein [Streptomyces sp. NPDC014006]|uniref:hypothetical protein n=1 Tax=Streptomyces sp. NPDC014006 TaxID=3364870 RepID=UPI0036FDB4BD